MDQRTTYHHGDLRRGLIKVASRQIAKNGADSVSMASVARLAGVSQPAPYRHFADRRALLEAVATEAFDTLSAALRQCVHDQPHHDPTHVLALTYVAYGEVNVELYRLMFASRLVPQADQSGPLQRASDECFKILSDAMSGGSPRAPARDDVYLTWAQLHGLVMLKADGFIQRPLRGLVELSWK